MLRDHRAIVSGQEQRQARHVLGEQRAVEALSGAEIGDVLLAHPQAALPLGDHCAWRDGVDADVVGPNSRARLFVRPTIAALAAE